MNRRAAFLAAAALLVATAALAHHNMSAIYDFNDKVTMTGTLSKVDWRNPHIELIVESKNGGGSADAGPLRDRRPVSSVSGKSIEPTLRPLSTRQLPPKPAGHETDLTPDSCGP